MLKRRSRPAGFEPEPNNNLKGNRRNKNKIGHACLARDLPSLTPPSLIPLSLSSHFTLRLISPEPLCLFFFFFGYARPEAQRWLSISPTTSVYLSPPSFIHHLRLLPPRAHSNALRLQWQGRTKGDYKRQAAAARMGVSMKD